MKKLFLMCLLALLMGACDPQVSVSVDDPEDDPVEEEDEPMSGDVGNDENVYWEASEFDKRVKVIYDGAEATIEHSIEGLTCYQ